MTYLEAVALSSLLFLTAVFVAYFFVSGFIWGAGFEPTRRKNIDLAAELLGVGESTLVYDLGSGTGDVVMRLAERYGARCVGIEVDPLKAWISRLRISRSARARSRVEIERRNFLSADVSRADAVYVFLSGGTDIMKRLGEKLARESKEGAKVASYVHSFPGQNAVSSTGEVRVYSFRAAGVNPANTH